jgi:uncharacterized protein involved in cysteine biosynthesis
MEIRESMQRLLAPIALSIGQIGDRAFLGAVLWSLVWSAAGIALLHVFAMWAVHDLLALHGWRAWLGDILGGVGASLLGIWLFLPLAALIATLFIDRVAHAVERLHYPHLPPAPGSPLLVEILDGLALAGRILLLSVVALVLALVLPGIGLLLAWGIGAYAIGRGLFITVALRRYNRREAQALYAAHRGTILAQGGALALASYIPGLNLLVPVLGAAAMVHVLDAISQHRVTTM